MLQGIPEEKRALAVDSMVYEANARLKDPVYGCTGIICILQQQILRMEGELANIKALLINSRQLQLNKNPLPPTSNLPENTDELCADLSELFSTEMSLDHLLAWE
ncbi:hypothetical protein SUGI_0186500 [Cryptomeria japonica]|nr:hypothetical protein SUGI_0186500 [Cryptomeria japonica]